MLLSRYQNKKEHEVGCDEVGRGCLAGPVVAAAVLLPKDYENKDIMDSKKLSEAKRMELEKEIKKHAQAYGIGMVSAGDIDRWNIRKSSIVAMHRALNKINNDIDYIVVDGNYFIPFHDIDYSTVIKGDSKYLSIAAASILAKNHRDIWMKNISDSYPEYQLHKNKGYATYEHREAIKKYGYSDIHRKSFQLKELNKPLSLFEHIENTKKN